ncbi:MAG: hypothetical protein JNM68_17270, partial [Dinghuibacter sp.]|nr:hypothetical protein [Dinghuibacter sp.]
VLLLLLFLLFPARDKTQRPFLYFLLTYSLILLILMGYSVPVTGAIIRYKVLAIPFLAMFCALQVNWKRVMRR